MVSVSNIDLEENLFRELKRVISALPHTKLLEFDLPSQQIADQGIDALAEIRTKNGEEIRLVIQFKAGGYPRDLEKASRDLKKYIRNQNNKETIPIIVSRAISPGSRKMLQDQEIGYFDAGGSLYLPLLQGLYLIDRPAPAQERKLQNIYEGKSAQVLHILLGDPAREWHVNELAELAEVSPYTVHHVFKILEEQAIVEKYGKGPDCFRILRNPAELLDSWAENYSYDDYKFLNYYKWNQSNSSLRDDLAKILEDKKIDYALALGTGAQMVAPFVTGSDRLYFLVKSCLKVDGAVEEAGLEPVDDGAVVTFITTKACAPFLNRQKIDGLWVASDIQLYLDLSKWRARGREQAEHLRRERLKF